MDALQYHREWVPTALDGCVLYLPFWRYGANTQKIWDQSPTIYGPELVTNGDFSSATGWTVEAEWTISDGKARAVMAAGHDVFRSVSYTSGKRYLVSLTVSNYVSGSFRVSIDGGNSYILNNQLWGNGHIEFGFTASAGDNTIGIGASGDLTADIDDVSVKEVLSGGNHGVITGAAPATYPLLSGAEIVTNGGFASDTAGWSALQSTLASIAGGQSGNCLEITRVSGDAQYAYQSKGLFPGRTYRLSGWVKSGTSGDGVFNFSVEDNGATFKVESSSTSAWTYHERFFVADNTPKNLWITKNNATPGTMLFDSISIQEVVGYEGLGWGFDGVDDMVNCGHSSSLGFGTGDFTLLITFKNLIEQTGWSFVLRKGQEAGSGLVVARNESWLRASIGPWFGDVITLGSFPVSPDETFTLGFVRENGNVYAYKNGVLKSGPIANNYDLGNQVNDDFTIMRGGGSGSYSFGRGIVNDALVLNRALSAVEIKSYFDLTRARYGV